MPFYFFQWTDVVVEHIARNGVSVEDFQNVVMAARKTDTSVSTSRDMTYGRAADGRDIVCIYEWLDKDSVFPVTAYEVEG
ncbi:MAG: hypothetical protein SH868_10005 [Bythopirellula sp.]|nr:hypothetical protein [Bythopirellula sp.]